MQKIRAGIGFTGYITGEPVGTLRLIAPGGAACGFHVGAQLWIDEYHRGSALSKTLVETMGDLLGGSPSKNEDGLGFSTAGYRAHERAR
ncbi:hypothetical protein BMI85_04955 [Thioclava sp. DLFJ4-1]|nr:hypothetical protein BMI85_04955 [Thioclava sp. DLFJ4-1]